MDPGRHDCLPIVGIGLFPGEGMDAPHHSASLCGSTHAAKTSSLGA